MSKSKKYYRRALRKYSKLSYSKDFYQLAIKQLKLNRIIKNKPGKKYKTKLSTRILNKVKRRIKQIFSKIPNLFKLKKYKSDKLTELTKKSVVEMLAYQDYTKWLERESNTWMHEFILTKRMTNKSFFTRGLYLFKKRKDIPDGFWEIPYVQLTINSTVLNNEEKLIRLMYFEKFLIEVWSTLKEEPNSFTMEEIFLQWAKVEYGMDFIKGSSYDNTDNFSPF